MEIILRAFHEWQLKELIPTYGDDISDVINFILLDWMSKNGHTAMIHNDDIKKLMEINKNVSS